MPDQPPVTPERVPVRESAAAAIRALEFKGE